MAKRVKRLRKQKHNETEEPPTEYGKGYRVGYGKPPMHSRFHKGQSGNRRGRPKGSFSVATMLDKALQETVLVNEGGKSKRVSKLAVGLLQQSTKAAKGDGKALKLLLQLRREYTEWPNPEDSIQTIVIDSIDAKVT